MKINNIFNRANARAAKSIALSIVFGAMAFCELFDVNPAMPFERMQLADLEKKTFVVPAKEFEAISQVLGSPNPWKIKDLPFSEANVAEMIVCSKPDIHHASLAAPGTLSGGDFLHDKTMACYPVMKRENLQRFDFGQSSV